jgi:hypothetical protein
VADIASPAAPSATHERADLMDASPFPACGMTGHRPYALLAGTKGNLDPRTFKDNPPRTGVTNVTDVVIRGADLGRLAVSGAGAHTQGVTMTALPAVDETVSADFAAVPDVDPDAVIDPHWLELQGDSLLPTLYMPPTMAGGHSPLMRLMALVLIAVFLLATVLGICLTYGPPNRPF